MSGYNRDQKTFTLTAIKLEHYHRNHPHTSFSRGVCPICHAQYGQEYMEPVAAFFRANGFDVVDVGDAHITISAPSKPRKKFGMWITKETDELYQLLAGRIEARPGSLPHLVNFEEYDERESHERKSVSLLESDRPIIRLEAWFQEFKEHLQRDSKNRPAIVSAAEIRLIQTIQAKIQELIQ